MSAKKIPELQELAGAVAQVDSEGATAAPEGAASEQNEIQAVQVLADEVGQLAGLLHALAQIAAPMFPTVAAIYTEETCAAVARGVVPVMLKRGWKIPGVAGFEEEIACAMVVLPMGFVTYQAIMADIAAAKQKSNAPAQIAEQAAQSLPVDVPEQPLPKVQPRG